MGLFAEQGQQRRRQPDRAEQVGGDRCFRVGQVFLLREQLFRAHDACVVDEEIERGELSGDLRGKGVDFVGVLDVELQRLHAGVDGGCLV